MVVPPRFTYPRHSQFLNHGGRNIGTDVELIISQEKRVIILTRVRPEKSAWRNVPRRIIGKIEKRLLSDCMASMLIIFFLAFFFIILLVINSVGGGG